MPKFYCEYCGIYLTHSSPSGRKQHGKGRKHIQNKVEYYSQFLNENNAMKNMNPFMRADTLPMMGMNPMMGMMNPAMMQMPQMGLTPISMPGIMPSNIKPFGMGGVNPTTNPGGNTQASNETTPNLMMTNPMGQNPNPFMMMQPNMMMSNPNFNPNQAMQGFQNPMMGGMPGSMPFPGMK